MSISANYPTIRPSLSLDFANTEQLDPRITFSRPTTAAYYDANTTALAEQNLVLQSQNFPTTWSNSFVTTNATATTAPDGTTTGNSLTSTSSSSTFTGVYQTCTNVTQTYSVYAKAGTSNFVSLINNNFGNSWATFNLSTGLVSSSALCTPSMVSVGNGWYRCIMANATGTNNNFIIAGKDADPGATPWNNGTMASGNYIYIWGAQLEQRSSVTAYNATTTTAITNYIPVLLTAPTNQARFDHNPTTRESLGLLIEEQRTNLETYSSDMSNAGWAKINTTVTTAANIAPDGTQTAQKLVESTATGFHYGAAPQQTIANGTVYTSSFYVKAAGRSYISAAGDATLGSLGSFTGFDLINGIVVSNGAGVTSSSITSVGNSWYRCTITATATNTIGDVSIVLRTTSGSSTQSYAGDGFSGVYIWGAQLEAGAFATSYIPTVASQVTRSADSATMVGNNFSSWYQQGSAGTFYLAGDYVQQTGNVGAMFGISDGTQNNRYSMILFGSGTAINNYGQSNGANVFSINNTITASTKYKGALSVAQGSIIATQNGVTGTASPSTPLPSGINRLDIGSISYASVWANSHVSKFAYYPVATTALQQQSLTGS